MSQRSLHRRLSPLALAAALALGSTGLNAAPRVYAGPGSFWDVVANWTGGILPGVGDDALLGAFNTEVRTTFTILSFSGTGTLTVSTGTLTTSAASSIAGFTLSGGALAGTGAVTISGAGTWTGGTMSGTGVTTSTGSFAFSGAGAKDLVTGRTLATAGTTTWTNTANDNGRIRTGAGAAINNSGNWDDQQAFNGAISPDFGGTANFNNTGTYTKSGAGTTTIAVAFNNSSSGPGTGVVNVNAGAMRLTGGGTSNGSFTGLAGTTLSFGGGHTLQAPSTINTAGTAEFSGSGSNTVAGSFSASTGTFFSGGVTTFTGTVASVGTTLTANGGTGTFNNAQAISTGALTLSSGAINFNNTGGATAATLNLSGGTLGGTSAVTVSGAGTWTSGTMTGAGATTIGGNLELSGSLTKDLTAGRTLSVAGTTTWTNTAANNGRVRTGTAAVINNNGSWLDQLAFDGAISPDFGGSAAFNNRGTYTKSGVGLTEISIAFNNTSTGPGTGEVAVNAGTLRLSGGGTSNGSFTGAAGTTLSLGGNQTLQAGSSISTAGIVDFFSGTNTLAGSFSAGTATSFTGGVTTFTGTVSGVGSTITSTNGTGTFNNTQPFNVSSLSLPGGGLNFNNTGGVTTGSLTLSGGTLGGTSSVTVNGTTTWTGGTMTGAGTTVATGALTISGGGVKDLTGGRTLNVINTTWTNTGANSGRIRTGGSAVIESSGTWADQLAFDSAISPDFGGAGTFRNNGVYTKSGNSVTSIGIAFDNTSTGAGTGVVNVNAGTLALGNGGSSNGSFQGAGTLSFGGGVYNLVPGSSVTNANVSFTSGTTNIAGAYSVGGTTTVSGGTANFTGAVANSGGNLVVSNGSANFSNTAGVTVSSLALSGGTVGGTQDVSVTGAMTWTSGTMTGTGRTLANGTLAISGAGVKDITGGRTLTTVDTTWTNTGAGNGRMRTGGGVINSTGTWADQQAFDSGISPDFGGGANFNNTGIYNKTGAGTTTIAIAFNNTGADATHGVVNVDAGSLVLSGGGTSNGRFQGASTLGFGGGTQDLLAASSVSNTNVVFSGGVTNVAGSYSVAGTTTVNGGTANFTGAVANSGGNLVVSSGAANFNNLAGVTVSTLTLSGGTVGGTQALTVSGDTNWTGGTMTGTGSTTLQGALSMNGSGVKDITGGRVLNAGGTTTWTNTAAGNGRIRTGGGAVINNSGSWLDQLAFDGRISPDFGGSSTFNNIGSYTKSGAALTEMNIAFVNGNATPGTGVVNLNAGTLQLSAGGSSVGSINVADGATLDFSAGIYTLGGAVTSSADGRVRVSGGTVNTSGTKSFAGLLELASGTLNLNADASAARYTHATSATLGGTGNLTISGSAVWTAGAMAGPGSTTSSGTLALSGAGVKDLTVGRALNTAGTTTWTNTAASNGRIRTGGAVAINNSGSWLDQLAFNASISPDFGAGGSFNNTGSYTKSGTAITDMAVAFVNGDATPGTGVVNLNAGTLLLSNGGNNLGTFNVADGSTLAFSSGTYTLGGTVASGASGRVLVSGGIVNTVGSKSFAGLLELSGGTLNVNAGATAASYLHATTATLGGTGNLTVSGSAVWTGGAMAGPGSTTSTGTLALSGAAVKDLTAGRTLNTAGTTTWTNTAASNGRIRTGGAVVIHNSGSWLDQLAFNGQISPDLGAGASFDNSGSYIKTGAGTTDISIAFSNPGRLSVSAGVLNLTGGLSNFAANTLTGGTFEVIGNSTLRFSGANIVTNAATLLLDGAGSALLNASNGANALAAFNANAAEGSFTIRNGRNFSSAGAFGNAGIVNVGGASTFTAVGVFTNQGTAQLQMAGGSLAGPSLVNAGTVSGFGSVVPLVTNTGTTRASGGTLTLGGGVQGSSGTVQVDSGATLALGATSTAGTLVHNGTLLALGANNITVSTDYDSANFGVGNGFNRRGGVSGSGQILAAGTVQQVLSGADLSGGSTANATLVLPTIRVGQGGISSNFTINNVGSGGPALRGALVTTGITNVGLSGSGVTDQNWGAITQGGAGQSFTVTFDPSFGQALSGQVLQVVNNFDNVAGQAITITGQAFNLASATAATPNPVVFANQRVGGTLSQSLTLGNAAPNSGFSEGLNATISASGTATAGGSFSLLAAGASSSALFVGIDTTTAGAKSGTATITLASDGTGTSGFTPLGIGTQAVNVSGNVYRLATASAATPSPVVLANQRVGGSLSQALSLTNTAAADGFSESLNATISASGTATAGGSFSLLAAGASSSALFVGVDTSTAGAKSGTATITLASDGTGTSGFAPLGIGTQTVNVSGNVFRLATASAATPSPVVLANQRVGGSLSQALSLTNTAAADGFSESLNATIAASGTATAGGSFSVLAAGAGSNALFVGVDTSTAGAKSGTATITLASDGTGTSGFAPLGIGTQTVNVSGNVYRLASASVVAPSPVVFANQRVGGTLSQALSLTNTAAADGFSEGLNASISASGTATAGGSFSVLAAGASSSALFVGVDTTTAGAKSGTATITLASDGTGTSGFAPLGIGTQTVNVSGNVYRLAQPSTVNPNVVLLGNQREGGTLTQSLTLANLAAADGFSESLNASISGSAGILTGGSFNQLAAGSSSSSLFVGVDASTAGTKTGTATIALSSDGTGTSGLAPLSLGTQVVNVTANVFRLASASPAAPSPVVLANQRVGGTLTQALTLTNTAAADSFSEGLSATIAASGSATAGGSFSVLAAGASSNALFVGVNTATAGAKSGTATIALSSDGTGSSGFGSLALGTQSVNVSGNVYRLATPGSITPTNVVLADQRIGGSLSRAISVSNGAAADGFSEGLSAVISGSGNVTASGSFSVLPAGSVDFTALTVGVDTSTAGAKAGSALINFASDGAGTSGFAPVGIGSQPVTVSGNVFRLAQPVVDTTPLTMVARVGDAAPSRTIGVTNNAPDLFTERLNASVGSTPAGIGSGPALIGLTPGGSGTLSVSLGTGTAGSFSGSAVVALVSSSAGTTSGAPDLALPGVNVPVTGRVYAPAVAQGVPTVIDFGIVRVGDTVAARGVNVGNGAAGALTDSLQATLSGGNPGFTAGGTVSGIAAGAANNTALTVQINTASAGVFSSNATLAMNSQNPEMADLALVPASIALQGQVNNLALAALSMSAGAGSFSGAALSYTLDFGAVQVGSGIASSTLSLANAATGPADALAGSWDLTGLLSGSGFTVGGFGSFTGLVAGNSIGGLTVSFDAANEGSFSGTLVFNGLSTNGSGPDLTLPQLSLHLQGNVVAVPEPGTWAMMLVGVLAMGTMARRRLRARAA